MNARLHTLNKAPDHPRCQRCLEALEAGDVLVLMESGVLALAADSFLAPCPDDVQIYAISSDLTAYSQLPPPEPGVEMIDYPGFVELVCRIGSPVNW